MKGHVGGGPVTDNLWVSADRQNLSRSLWILLKLRLRRGAHMSQKRKHTSFVIFVQERLPEMPVLLSLIPRGLDRTST
jgi:hypothetical protein